MNFMKAIVAAGLVAASTSAFAADITGAGATVPFPIYSKWEGERRTRARNVAGECRRRCVRDLALTDLFEMSRCLQRGDRQWTELSVARLRRRHQADPGQDRDIRRHRRAAETRSAREGRPGAMADGDGRD